MHEHLKQSNSQHYQSLNREYRIKVVIRGFPWSPDTEIIKETSSCRYFNNIKVYQIMNWGDRILLPLYLYELHKNGTLNEILLLNF